MTSEEYKEAVLQAKEHILAGDIFQIVLSQRFERRTFADPFEVYRALRVVNPSPHMTYMQVSVFICQLSFLLLGICISKTVELVLSMSFLSSSNYTQSYDTYDIFCIRLEGVYLFPQVQKFLHE